MLNSSSYLDVEWPATLFDASLSLWSRSRGGSFLGGFQLLPRKTRNAAEMIDSLERIFVLVSGQFWWRE